MQFSQWKNYFLANRDHFADIDFKMKDTLTPAERKIIFSSIQQFQRGENSEGKHLFAFARKFPDPEYLECIKLFIPEEQTHARVLGQFMKKHDIPVIRGHWVDGVFRWLRKSGGIENTVRVLMVAEIIAKVYYVGLHNCTNSALLQKICLRVLKDEDAHIRFQCDVLKHFYAKRSFPGRWLIRGWQFLLMTGTIIVVWWGHGKVLKKGGYSFIEFLFESLLVLFEAERLIMSKPEFFKGKKIATI